MTSPQLSFTPDRRSVQGTTFQYSQQPSGFSGKREFSSQDSMVFKLDKIYQIKYPQMSKELRETLIKILVPDVPLMHHNLEMIAASNYIIYHMRLQNGIQDIDQLTPEQYNLYFDHISGIIVSDVSGKNTEELNSIRANFKTTLFRYIIYVWKHTSK